VRVPRAYFPRFFFLGEFDGLIKSDKTFEEEKERKGGRMTCLFSPARSLSFLIVEIL